MYRLLNNGSGTQAYHCVSLTRFDFHKVFWLAVQTISIARLKANWSASCPFLWNKNLTLLLRITTVTVLGMPHEITTIAESLWAAETPECWWALITSFPYQWADICSADMLMRIMDMSTKTSIRWKFCSTDVTEYAWNTGTPPIITMKYPQMSQQRAVLTTCCCALRAVVLRTCALWYIISCFLHFGCWLEVVLRIHVISLDPITLRWPTKTTEITYILWNNIGPIENVPCHCWTIELLLETSEICIRKIASKIAKYQIPRKICDLPQNAAKLCICCKFWKMSDFFANFHIFPA